MAEESVGLVPVRGKGTVSFSRKVQVREYEAAEAFMSVQFDFDPALLDMEAADGLVVQAKNAFYDAKAIVFDELGIEFDIVEGKVVEKLVEKHFAGATEVKQSNGGGSGQTHSSGGDEELHCPTCDGPMWDNRAKKASGQFNKKAPDAKCKDKDCDGVIWPPRK